MKLFHLYIFCLLIIIIPVMAKRGSWFDLFDGDDNEDSKENSTSTTNTTTTLSPSTTTTKLTTTISAVKRNSTRENHEKTTTTETWKSNKWSSYESKSSRKSKKSSKKSRYNNNDSYDYDASYNKEWEPSSSSSTTGKTTTSSSTTTTSSSSTPFVRYEKVDENSASNKKQSRRTSLPDSNPKSLAEKYVERNKFRLEQLNHELEFDKLAVAHQVLKTASDLIIHIQNNITELLGPNCREFWAINETAPTCKTTKQFTTDQITLLESLIDANKKFRNDAKSMENTLGENHKQYESLIMSTMHPDSFNLYFNVNSNSKLNSRQKALQEDESGFLQDFPYSVSNPNNEEEEVKPSDEKSADKFNVNEMV